MSRAFTLLELLLVLALLVVLAGLAMPLFEGSFSALRLRRATDQVLAVWVRARSAAIESGQPHQFRFRADSGDYLVEPWPRDEENSKNPATARDSSGEWRLELHNEDGTLILRDRLPEGIVITGGELVSHGSAQGARSPRAVESLAGATGGAGPSGTGWSTPILFHPDGTALNASLLLGNERRLYQRAALRGLTGSGHPSQLIPAGELAR